MAELMDKQGILDELHRRSGNNQQQAPQNLMDKQQILDSLRQKASGQGTGTFAPVKQDKTAKDFVAHLKAPQESQGWFQKGAFEDGYQFGDLTKTILGTGRDVKEDAAAGAVGVGEKALDFLAFIAPYISQGMWNMNGGDFAPAEFRQAQQQQFQSAKDLSSEFIKKDIIDEQKIGQAVAKIGDGLIPNLILGKEKADDMSVLGEKSDALVQSLGQMALTAAMGGAVPWWVVTGASSFGGEAENALKQGATMEQAGLSAAVSAGAEILTEKLFGGSGLGEKGFINLDSLTNGISNKLVKTLLDYGVDMAAEGAEEVVSSVASNLGSALYREENLADILFSKEALQEYLDNFVSGAAVGGLMNIGKVGSSISNKTDYRNGLTAQEQKVFDTEYNAAITEAQKSGKLTREQKAEIYDSVLEDVISRRPAPQQAEKVPTQEESAADGQQTAQTVPQTATNNQQTMTPQQAMQETIAEIVGIPSVSQAVDSFRQNGTVSNKQAESIISDDGVFREILEIVGIAPPSTKSESRAAVKQAVETLAQQAQTTAETAAQDESVVRQAQRNVAQDAYNAVEEDTRPVMRNKEAEAEYQQRLAEWEARQKATSGFGSVGAANAGFSEPSPIDPLIERYGSLPSGENPVRSDELPKSVTGKDRVSQTAVTVKGAKVTPDEFVPLLDRDVADGGFSYIPITNNATTQKAMDYISYEGWQQALANWNAAVENGKSGADLVAQGALLYNNAVNAGDHKLSLDILHTYQKLGRNTAQGLQAFRILKSLAPSDKLYMVEKSIQKMVDDLGYDITLDQDLVDEFNKAETDEQRDAVMDKIMQSVADQIPSTFMDKVNAVRYLFMLGNLKTQSRNVLGNLAMASLYEVKNEIAAGLELAAHKISGGKIKRTKDFTVSKAQLRSGYADFVNVEAAVTDNAKFGDPSYTSDVFKKEISEKRRILKVNGTGTAANVVNKLLAVPEGYRKAVNWAMEKGDILFSKPAYARALAGYLKANGVTTSDFSKVDTKLMDDARLYAIKEAQEQTFRDNNAFSTWLSKVGRRKDTWKPAKVLAEGVLPFRKTPANVLLRAEEFSPLGIINSTVLSVEAALKKGDVSANDVINSWAKSITGTGLFVLGMLLSNAGHLIAGGGEDKEKNYFDKASGLQRNSFVFDDGTNFTIDFLGTGAIPLLMGATLNEIRQDKDIEAKDVVSALTSLADPMIEMSMLQSLQDTIDDVRYSEDPFGQIIINAALNYLLQATTSTLGGQIERTFENTRMETFVDKDSQVPAWLQKVIGKASAKTPIWEYSQIPYINAWGEVEENLPTGVNAIYNLLSPAYVDKASNDPLTNELNRLRNATGVNVYPDRADSSVTFSKNGESQTYNLSADEYVEMAKLQGKTQKDLLDDIVQTEGYASLSEDLKADLVKKVYEYARNYAKGEIVPDHPGVTTSWIVKTINSGGDLAQAFVSEYTRKQKENDKEARKESFRASQNG